MSAANVMSFYASSSRTDFFRTGNRGVVSNVAIWNTGVGVIQERETTTRATKIIKKVTKCFVQNEGTFFYS